MKRKLSRSIIFPVGFLMMLCSILTVIGQTPTQQTDVQFLNSWAVTTKEGLPKTFGDFQLTEAMSQCPKGCQEELSPDGGMELALIFKTTRYTLQSNFTDEVIPALKPYLTPAYCESEGVKRNIRLVVFVMDSNGRQLNNFFVFPKDCSADRPRNSPGQTDEGAAQNDNNANSLIGMTIAEARKFFKGAKFSRQDITEEVPEQAIQVGPAGQPVMYLITDEKYLEVDNLELEKIPIRETAKIEAIVILGSAYQTAEGVRPGLTINGAENKLGKLKEIVLYELDGSEHATFSNQTDKYDLTVTPPGEFNPEARAGIYQKDEYTTTKYIAGTVISSIRIWGANRTDTLNNQPNYLITDKSVGEIQLGMTIAEARKAMSDAEFSRTSDGDGVALISVKRGDVQLMTLYANEEDREKPINEDSRIVNIEVWDSQFQTAEGVHPKMKLSEVEKIYGKVTKIIKSEIESREFAECTNQPKGLLFRLESGDGIYPEGQRETKRYAPQAAILSITVS